MTEIDRRGLMRGAAGGLTAALAWAVLPKFAQAGGTLYLGGRETADGRFAVAVADAGGRTRNLVALPARCHGLAKRPGRGEAVAVARRPGTFAAVFDLAAHEPSQVFHTPKGRHFQGHAVFDPAGRTLFTAENDYDKGRGVIGIYDATDGYKRIGEVPCHGIGCHEVILMPDGRTLAVANGGILTHPDSGRIKLNVPTMEPSLAYVDPADGRLLDRLEAPEGRRRKLGIRHIVALPDGRLALACQDEGPAVDAMPLVALHRPGSGQLTPVQAPPALWRAMTRYCGAIAADPAGRVIAASAPRGNCVVFWDTASGRHAGTLDIADSCGIATGPAAGTIAVSNGMGAFLAYDPAAPRTVPRPASGALPWDNHIIAVTA